MWKLRPCLETSEIATIGATTAVCPVPRILTIHVFASKWSSRGWVRLQQLWSGVVKCAKPCKKYQCSLSASRITADLNVGSKHHIINLLPSQRTTALQFCWEKRGWVFDEARNPRNPPLLVCQRVVNGPISLLLAWVALFAANSSNRPAALFTDLLRRWNQQHNFEVITWV